MDQMDYGAMLPPSQMVFFVSASRVLSFAQGQQKERSNKKVEENKPAIKSNFLSKYKWTGHDFEI